MPTISTDLIVDKSNLAEARFVETELPDAGSLPPGQALIKVDEFAFTANNITYAVIGDAFGYWDFFPASDPKWGRVPVWGFGDVITSTADGLSEGDRLYGYFPMSTHLVIEPGRMTKHSLMDMAAHRQERAPVYNQYTFTKSDPTYKPNREAMISLFRPLFTTSFLLDDFFAENGFFGANTALLTSASSKTSIGLAYLLSTQRKKDVSVVGLTGAGNKAFVEGLGIYDKVVTYDALESLDVVPAAFIDMAGNADVLARVHMHFGDNLKNSCLVGATHWEARGGGADALQGPKPEVFFAPGHAQARMKEWGGDGFQARVSAVWNDFIPQADGWVKVKASRGTKAVQRLYQETLAGSVDPAEGHILSVWE